MSQDKQVNPLAVEKGLEKDPSDSTTSNHHGLREIVQRFLSANGEDSIPSQINFLGNVLASLNQRLTGAALVIAGVELTQATQYFSINGQGSEYAADNSVPLIANRDLILRVYVNDRRDQSGAVLLPKYVTGRVDVYRVNSYGPDQHIATLGPTSGSLRTRSSAAIDRGDPDQTLNFRLRGAKCQGTLRFRVSIRESHPQFNHLLAIGAGPLSSENSTPVESMEFMPLQLEIEAADLVASPEGPSPTTIVYGRFDNVPTFRIRFVLVNYTGFGLDISPPSGWNIASDLEYVLLRFPIGRLEFDDCIVCSFDGDLTVGDPNGGGCGEGWGELLDLLRDVNAGSNSICIGVLPEGVPRGLIGGCGGSGVAAYFLGDSLAMAHEIGHALGRRHTPNSGPGVGPLNPDPNYPDYDDYITGSIGEYGFDMSNNRVYNPALTLDLMSYDALYWHPDWVSPYTYTGLLNGIIARMSAMSPSRGGAAGPPEKWLHLKFRVSKDGSVRVRPSFVREQAPIPAESFGRTDITCELVDREGGVLKNHHCTLNNPYKEVGAPHIEFFEVLPFDPKVASIVFRRNGEVLDTLCVDAANAPTIALAEPEIIDDSLRLRWDADNMKAYLVEFSVDGGAIWQTVTLGGIASECEIDVQLLPPGDNCQIRVLVTSGIITEGATTKTFSMRAVPRIAQIIRPAPGYVLRVGDELTLLGGGFGAGKGLAAPEETQWVSDIDGSLGSGNWLSVRLSEGTHTLTLTVPDGLRGVARAQSAVFVCLSTGC